MRDAYRVRVMRSVLGASSDMVATEEICKFYDKVYMADEVGQWTETSLPFRLDIRGIVFTAFTCLEFRIILSNQSYRLDFSGPPGPLHLN